MSCQIYTRLKIVRFENPKTAQIKTCKLMVLLLVDFNPEI